MSIFSKAKSKMIDITSDIISAPAQIRAYRKTKKAEYDTKVLKQARKDKEEGYRYNPNEGDYRDPKFRTAVEAIGIKGRLERKVK